MYVVVFSLTVGQNKNVRLYKYINQLVTNTIVKQQTKKTFTLVFKK